jgi:hypothetical protein
MALDGRATLAEFSPLSRQAVITRVAADEVDRIMMMAITQNMDNPTHGVGSNRARGATI